MSPIDYSAIVARFDQLPDDAIVPDPAAAKVLGTSVWTLRRHNIVPPIEITSRRRGRRAGDIRAFARGQLTPA